jgi:small-conductance mechanosensitive channel
MSVNQADAMNALDRVMDAARAIGVDVGAYRLSLYGVLSAIIIVVLLYTFVKLSLRGIKWLLRRNSSIDPAQRLLTEKLVGVGLFGLATFIGIDLLGIDLTALAVFSGALGLAIGFGLQKTVGNLIAGIILLMDRSVKPGDTIVVADAVGRVNKIGVRAVSVITRDGKEHLVPNELLMTERVENWSYSSRDVRVRAKVGVAYSSDPEQVQAILISCATDCPRVLVHPAPVAWIVGFGDSSIDFELRFWISDPEAGLGNVQGEVFMRIWKAFKREGIDFPFPQQDIHIRSLPPHAGEVAADATQSRGSDPA